jgi:hypothetical protein
MVEWVQVFQIVDGIATLVATLCVNHILDKVLVLSNCSTRITESLIYLLTYLFIYFYITKCVKC